MKPPSDIDLIASACAVSLPGLFQERVKRTPAQCAYRQFDHTRNRWLDYSWLQVAAKVDAFRGVLQNTGLQPGDRVAINLPNSVDWVAVDIAAMAERLVTVPLYVHDSPKNIVHIVTDSGARLCVVDTLERWSALAPWLATVADPVQILVVAKPAETMTSDSGPAAPTFIDDHLAICRSAGTAIPAAPDSLATIIYTSGTTGCPKGVMLSHAAILWNAEAVATSMPPFQSDIFLSILPLAHAFERTMGYYLPMMAGSTVAYARSAELFAADLKAVRPTVLIAVPRLYERMLEAIRAKLPRFGWIRKLFDLTARVGWQDFQAKRGRMPPPGLCSKLFRPVLIACVARPVMRAFGGRLRVAVSGGARLPDDVASFLIGLGMPLLEGYGLTEAAPVVTVTTFADNLPGSVGRPLPGLELCLGPDQDLRIRSPGVMLGYWQNPAATASIVDKEGWLHTADRARFENGYIFIEGRLSDTVILSTGEKVNPAIVEDLIRGDRLFAQICVVGTDRPCLVALVVLAVKPWAAFARSKNLHPLSLQDPTVTTLILDRINSLLSDLPEFLAVRGAHLTIDPWTIENNLLTPTLKIRRKALESRFEQEISDLYARIAERRADGQMTGTGERAVSQQRVE
ncbi:long-chain fatty acid--CoA ligase [Sphingorhabdus sp.]|uniref:AMP-dependent synthetase/ligase n=1 Tax=Sphingorhabdus sp. TaxID=1902408 RepID=UPI0035B20F7A